MRERVARTDRGTGPAGRGPVTGYAPAVHGVPVAPVTLKRVHEHGRYLFRVNVM